MFHQKELKISGVCALLMVDVKKRLAEGWMRCRAVIELVGKPKEHIVETMKLVIQQIKDDPKMKVFKGDLFKPVQQEQVWSTFAELEILFAGKAALTHFCFDYMPSSIEVYEPTELVYSANDFTDYLNDLQARLHKFDMLIKNLSAENKVVKQNGLTLARNVVIATLESGPKTLLEISKRAGMPEEHIKKFVNILVKEGKIKEKEGKYCL